MRSKNQCSVFIPHSEFRTPHFPYNRTSLHFRYTHCDENESGDEYDPARVRR